MDGCPNATPFYNCPFMNVNKNVVLSVNLDPHKKVGLVIQNLLKTFRASLDRLSLVPLKTVHKTGCISLNAAFCRHVFLQLPSY